MRNDKWVKNWDDVYNKEYKVTNQWNKVVNIIKQQQPDLFIDLGPGRVGSEAWEVNKTFPNCKVVGYEPQINRYDILKSAKYPGDLYKFVISDVDDMVSGFTGHPEGKSDFWLYGGDSINGAYLNITLPSHKLDTLFINSDFNNIFIWADIEGSELVALKGAKKLLKSKRVLGLNLELRKTPEAVGACSAKDVANFLMGYGYLPTEDLSVLNNYTHKDFVFIKGAES